MDYGSDATGQSMAMVSELMTSARSMMRSRDLFQTDQQGTYGDNAITDIRIFTNAWKMVDLKTVFKRCRELAWRNQFVSWACYFKKLLFFNGFRVMGVDEKVAAKYLPQFRRIARDVFDEYLTNDNAIAVWMQANTKDTEKGETPELPPVMVMNCENCRYDDTFGIPSLTIQFSGARKLSADRRNQLGPRYADALEKGGEITLDEEEGEYYRVLSSDKLGNGLGMPRLRAVFDLLSTLDLANKGDWNAFWTMKDVIRQIKKGHAITTGNLAGMPMHFLKKEEMAKILAGLSGKAGAYDVVSNFDVEIAYPTLEIEPKFLDPKKLGGVMEQLLQWLGPVGLLFKTTQGRALDDLIPVLNAEMTYHRAFVKDLLEEIFNDPAFISPGGDEDVPGKADGVASPRITVEFNELTLVTFKNLLAYATMILTNGIASPQTTRRIMSLNEDEENALMKKAAANKALYTPVFEAKQGLLQQPADPDAPEPSDNGGGKPVVNQN